MHTLSVFTTWHPVGYKKYGKDYIETYLQNWPVEVPLTIYAEDHNPFTYNADNISVLDQRTALPDLKSWQEKHKDNDHAHGWNSSHTKKSFLWDASRFANKTFAVWHFADYTNADIMIWCDGDVKTHTPIPIEFLHSIGPTEAQLATYLGRKTWPECGWVMYNRKHPEFNNFMKQWRWIYESDDIFNHVEYHDSFDSRPEWEYHAPGIDSDIACEALADTLGADYWFCNNWGSGDDFATCDDFYDKDECMSGPDCMWPSQS